MKPFVLLRLAAVSFGLGALLYFPPSCKAQSEVSPDHFDGTDPWQAAAQKSLSAKPKPAPVRTALQSSRQKTGSTASLQLAATRELSKPVPHEALAIQDKRKPAVRKSDKE